MARNLKISFFEGSNVSIVVVDFANTHIMPWANGVSHHFLANMAKTDFFYANSNQTTLFYNDG